MSEAFIGSAESAAPIARRRFLIVSWLCAISPVVLLFLFITFGLHVRLGLGHWPTPMFEDYHSPAFHIHEVILGIWLHFAVYAAGPLWLLCLLIPRLRPTWPRPLLTQLCTFSGGWLLGWALLTFDPTTFSAWFLD
jgi:hypothetical protein